MNRGRIYFYPSQRIKHQQLVRDEILMADADTCLKILDFQNLLNSTTEPLTPAGKLERLKAYRETIRNGYVDRISAFETATVKYNMLLTYWFSVFGYLPLTKSTVTVSGQPQEFRPYEYGSQGNFLLETNSLNIFGNLSVAYSPNDNNTTLYGVFSDLFDSKDTTDIKWVDRALGLTLSKAVYTGSYQSFETWRFKPQLVFSLKCLADALANSKVIRNVSLNVFGDLQRGKYQVSNLGFGLLFSVHVNAEKPLNTEFFVTLRDIDNKLLPNVAGYRKNTLGFRLTLPFNSIIY